MKKYVRTVQIQGCPPCHRAGPARIRRPTEWAPEDTPEPQPEPSADLVADSLDDLAAQLGT
jgi:hypothetical protein